MLLIILLNDPAGRTQRSCSAGVHLAYARKKPDRVADMPLYARSRDPPTRAPGEAARTKAAEEANAASA